MLGIGREMEKGAMNLLIPGSSQQRSWTGVHALAGVTIKLQVQRGCKIQGEHLSALSFPLKSQIASHYVQHQMQSLTFICYVKGLLVKVPLFELMAGWPSGELVVKLVSQCGKVRASSSDLISQTSCRHQAVMRIKYSLLSPVGNIKSMYDQAILIEF